MPLLFWWHDRVGRLKPLYKGAGGRAVCRMLIVQEDRISRYPALPTADYAPGWRIKGDLSHGWRFSPGRVTDTNLYGIAWKFIFRTLSSL